MAGQGPSRRELLQALSIATVASTFPHFSRWGYAFAEQTHAHAHGAPLHHTVRPAYHPQFFSAHEYKTLEALTDLILPPVPQDSHSTAGRHPRRMVGGAKEAGVAEFIDFAVLHDPTQQTPFRSGLQWVDGAAGTAGGFVSLSTAAQQELLERLAYAAKHREEEKPGQEFFRLVRRYTVMGFYTTRIGLESLDYPGLTFYSTSPGCEHHDNPEHTNL